MNNDAYRSSTPSREVFRIDGIGWFQGFGGKFGVQKDRVDKNAHSFEEQPEQVGTNYEKVKPDTG
jgi:hypothetical protein